MVDLNQGSRSTHFVDRIKKIARDHEQRTNNIKENAMHPAKIDRISALLNTSAQDASISLNRLAEDSPAQALELCAGALVRLNATQAEKTSHRKAFATAARKALKQLEQGPQS